MVIKNMKIKISKNIKIVGILALMMVVGFGYHVYWAQSKLPLTSQNSTGSIAIVKSMPHSSAAVGMAVEYAANFSNDKVLMGASHDVFVGRVLEKLGTKELGIGPETQFRVQIILNIKGSLHGTVTVDQQGGYENGVLYYVQGGAPFLKPGVTYLLATRYNAQENWYTLNPSVSGSQFILDDNGLSIDKLRAWAQNDLRVKKLQEAYPNEVLLDADIKSNNAINSYQSLYGGMPPTSSTGAPTQ